MITREEAAARKQKFHWAIRTANVKTSPHDLELAEEACLRDGDFAVWVDHDLVPGCLISAEELALYV